MRSETLDEEEVRLFNRLAEDWWDEEGEMSFLHSTVRFRIMDAPRSGMEEPRL